MSKTIAICNQKGGVTKTTTTLNLGIGLARKGKNVLLIDGDPQNDLTSALGWDADSLDQSLGSLMYFVTLLASGDNSQLESGENRQFQSE